MSRGRRYNGEPKLNMKKVIGVIIAIALIIMFVIGIEKLLNTDLSSNNYVSTTYFLINENNKWGVIDNNAKKIIEPIYNEAIIIPNKKKDIFICTYNENYNDGTYKTKVLNLKGEEIFSQFDKVEALENYDENNNLWYEENVLLVQKNGKYGLINLEGKEILETNFDNIYTLKGIENCIITEKNSKKGMVNRLGLEIIENKYDEIKLLGKDTRSYIIKSDNKYGITETFACKYEDIKPLNNNEIFCVKENGKYKVINKEEKTVLNEKFDNIEIIKDNIIVYKFEDKYCAIDIKNNIKLKNTYKTLKYTENGLFIARTDKKYGIIDINGNNKIKQEYSNINYYEDINIYELEGKDSQVNTILNKELKEIIKGIISEVNSEKSYIKLWTENGYGYYKLNGEKIEKKDILINNNLFINKQNDKYGLVDIEGNVIVDYIYDDAIEQNEFGYIAVKKDGLWGCLDKNGKVIVETKYNLDNNLLIDFIGPYHLGIDINLMYYTK